MQALDNVNLLVEYLAHQQFYSREDDVILSRDTNALVRIPGARMAFNAFIDSLTAPIKHIYPANIIPILRK
ncbi:hypothetical protein EU537_10560 [Candidatus Thorarchaeota archaeon]|nr:MAG: hypothetical protein EU537_10560 [Candidatus Thorarchaeota archaeon]